MLLWDIGHGLMIGDLKGHTDTVYALKFSRDGEILASGLPLQIFSEDNARSHRLCGVCVTATSAELLQWWRLACLFLHTVSTAAVALLLPALSFYIEFAFENGH